VVLTKKGDDICDRHNEREECPSVGLSVAASDSEPQWTEDYFQIVPVLGAVSKEMRDRIASFNGDRETSQLKPGLVRG
jgi:hypothetical protein